VSATEIIVVVAAAFGVVCGFGMVGLVAWALYGWWKAR
jgi:hypothetical protein